MKKKLNLIQRSKDGSHCDLFRCYCGKEFITRRASVKSGHTRSCGCLQRANTAVLVKIRWKDYIKPYNIKSPEYKAWGGMRQRCYNKKSQGYKYYGGRGIKVCKRWRNSYPNFLADMGKKLRKDLSIDRINNNGDYKPSNCRWATKKQQVHNRRNTK